MQVHNRHSRVLPASTAEAGALLDALASDREQPWGAHWPPMMFDRPLGVGARGGHGPVHYEVVQHVPGRWVRFRFSRPSGFDGFHEFTVRELPDGRVELAHLVSMRTRATAILSWPLAWRHLHDACLEEGLDRAERALTGTVRGPARWSPYVRGLRLLITVVTGKQPHETKNADAVRGRRSLVR